MTCKLTPDWALDCADWNAHADSRHVCAFPAAARCVAPDLDHEWQGRHRDANFAHPERSLTDPRNDGFVMQNHIMAPDTYRTGPADGRRAMTFYTHADITFYHDVAANFAISDRCFGSLLGASDPNHAFHLASSFFCHLTDEAVGGPRGGYRPLHSTIYDLLSAAHVDWAESFQDVPEGLAYLRLGDPHFIRHADLLDQLKGAPRRQGLARGGPGQRPQRLFSGRVRHRRASFPRYPARPGLGVASAQRSAQWTLLEGFSCSDYL